MAYDRRFCSDVLGAEEVAELARWTHEGLERVLERHGRSLDEFDDELAQEQLVLASCYGAAVGDRQLLGEYPRWSSDPAP